MAIVIGQQLGSYEITSLLGKGGMSEVYRARDTKLKREVAIKILPDDAAMMRVSRIHIQHAGDNRWSGVAHRSAFCFHAVHSREFRRGIGFPQARGVTGRMPLSLG